MTNSNLYENDILSRIGEYGRYQWLIWCWLQLIIVVVSGNMQFLMFAAIQPKCHSHSDVDHDFNATLMETNGTFLNIEKDSERGFYSATMQMNLTGDREYLMTVAQTAQLASTLTGSFIGGHLADRFGRRVVVSCALLGTILAGTVRSLSPNMTYFTLASIIIGLCMSPACNSAFILLNEQITSAYRCRSFLGGYALGAIVAAINGLTTRHWQIYGLVINTFALVPLLMTFFVHESSKWLLDTGRIGKAQKVLVKMAHANGQPDVKDRAKSIKMLLSDVRSHDDQSKVSVSTTSSWRSFLSDRHSMWTLFMLMFYWFSTLHCLLGLVLFIGNFSDSPAVTLLMSGIGSLIVNGTSVAMDKTLPGFGRRVIALIGSCSLFLTTSVLLALHLGEQWYPVPRQVAAVILACGLSVGEVSWQAASLWSVELFETRHRATAGAVCSCCASLGGTLAPLVILTHQVHSASPLACFTLVSGLCTLMVLCFSGHLMETKGKPLPHSDL